ncbi:MAG: hypothetical protein BGO60_03310 [Thiobacillus sp. 65-1059]|nr:MAG: hypothetical protein BGO60_03310 [Thiobacillus sp. 65-1059]
MADVIDIKTKRKSTKKPEVKDPELALAEEAVGPFAAMVLRRQEREDKGILDFDWNQYLTRIEVKGGTEFDDLLDYTTAGRKRFSEIFIQTFGFPRLPSTWGELMALDDYCSPLDYFARSPRGLAITAEYWPDQLLVTIAYKNGDIFSLRRAHTESFITEITTEYLAR